MVYVRNIEGKALMPTSNAKARKLLKQKKKNILLEKLNFLKGCKKDY